MSTRPLEPTTESLTVGTAPFLSAVPQAPRARLNWEAIIPISLFHAVAITGPWYYSPGALLAAVVLWWVSLGLGITLGWHRLLTHSSFETYRLVRYVLCLLGCLAFMVPPLEWIGVHRLHHRDSDTGHDPHSPRENFFWGHIGWLFRRSGYYQEVERCVTDLRADHGLVWINRLFFLPQLLAGVALYGLGGWSWVVWGVFVRTVFSLHCTFMVNSVTHTWGYRNFESRDNSRNNPLVALLTFGEGWHNNHHADQRCAAHGRRWWEVDPTYWTILLMERLGLAWNVVRPQGRTPQARGSRPTGRTPDRCNRASAVAWEKE